jgi:hypothetical protein
MKRLDVGSSLLAGVAGGILLWLTVQIFDQFENNSPSLSVCVSSGTWLLLGFVVGLGVQVTERLTGAS